MTINTVLYKKIHCRLIHDPLAQFFTKKIHCRLIHDPLAQLFTKNPWPIKTLLYKKIHCSLNHESWPNSTVFYKTNPLLIDSWCISTLFSQQYLNHPAFVVFSTTKWAPCTAGMSAMHCRDERYACTPWMSAMHRRDECHAPQGWAPCTAGMSAMHRREKYYWQTACQTVNCAKYILYKLFIIECPLKLQHTNAYEHTWSFDHAYDLANDRLIMHMSMYIIMHRIMPMIMPYSNNKNFNVAWITMHYYNKVTM